MKTLQRHAFRDVTESNPLYARHTLSLVPPPLQNTECHYYAHAYTNACSCYTVTAVASRLYILLYVYIACTRVQQKDICTFARATDPELLIKTTRRYRISGLTDLHPQRNPPAAGDHPPQVVRLFSPASLLIAPSPTRLYTPIVYVSSPPCGGEAREALRYQTHITL